MQVRSFAQAVEVTWSPGDSGPRVPQWTIDQVHGCLHTVDSLLAGLGIPYVAIGGTLLGAIRHQGLIPWDVDADISIRRDDVPALIREARRLLPQRGFGLGFERRFALLKIFPLEGFKIHPWHRFRFPYLDIFPMDRHRSGRWTHISPVTRRRWPNDHLDEGSFTDLERYTFGPLQIAGPPPALAHRYLDSAYGPNWRTEASFDPYRVSGLRNVPDSTFSRFPPALPSESWIEQWRQTQ